MRRRHDVGPKSEFPRLYGGVRVRQHWRMHNHAAHSLCLTSAADPRIRAVSHTVRSATVVDFGVGTPGSLEAGLLLSRICLGDAAEVSIVAESFDLCSTDLAVLVRTDHPVLACLGSQYAGWPVAVGEFFAMGSGPMRMARGREDVLDHLGLAESPEVVGGVLECNEIPPPMVIDHIAEQCGVETKQLAIAVAPCGSIAGTVQVIARSVETALHKLHALSFDVRAIISAAGVAPLAPPAKPSDAIGGIGRTNDSILYGGRVTLWVDCDQEAVDEVGPSVPSGSSKDHGRPFASVFKEYDFDFYRVDPLLFSPAVVTIINRRSGISRRFGEIQSEILRQSFLS